MKTTETAIKQIDQVIDALNDIHLKLKNKGKLIGKLKSSRDIIKNINA